MAASRSTHIRSKVEHKNDEWGGGPADANNQDSLSEIVKMVLVALLFHFPTRIFLLQKVFNERERERKK
jgi:hypothetical protein